MNCLRQELYPAASIDAATITFDNLVGTLPKRVAAYMKRFKRGVILQKLTLAARKRVLQRSDGTVDFPWTQGSESIHMVLARRMPGMRRGKPGFFIFLRGLLRYFKEKTLSLTQARCEIDCRTARGHTCDCCLGLDAIMIWCSSQSIGTWRWATVNTKKMLEISDHPSGLHVHSYGRHILDTIILEVRWASGKTRQTLVRLQ